MRGRALYCHEQNPSDSQDGCDCAHRIYNPHRYKVLRFWNNDVLGNIEGVLTVIQTELAAAGDGT
ncbi:DUF559 domain-containing protein [Bradyrhizobium liaoningense]|uniref:DUF559 domain-containing protein n=1 Tax=Bradyrhizobium liaoningense TaxID=43992 RepID=UPI0032DE9459